MAESYRFSTYLASILCTSIISTTLICSVIAPLSFSSILPSPSSPPLSQAWSPPTEQSHSSSSSSSRNWISTDQALYSSYSHKSENYFFSFKSQNQDVTCLSETREGGGNDCRYRQDYADDHNYTDDFDYGNDKSARDIYSRETSILIKSQIRNILHHNHPHYQDNNNNRRGHGRSYGKAMPANQKYLYISGPQDAYGLRGRDQKGYVVLRPYSEHLVYSTQHPHSHSTGFSMGNRKLNVVGSGRRRSASRAWNPSSTGASNVNRWYSDLRQHQHHYCSCDRNQDQPNKHHRNRRHDDTTAVVENISNGHVDSDPHSHSRSGNHNNNNNNNSGKFQQQRKNSSTFLLASFLTSFPTTLSEFLNAQYCSMLSLLNHLVFLFCNANGGYTPNPYDFLSSSRNTHTPQRLAPNSLIAMLASNLLIRLGLLIIFCVGAFYYCITVMDQQQQQIAGGAMLGRSSTGSNWWGENGIGSGSRTTSTTASVSGSEPGSAAINNSNFGDSSTSSSASSSPGQQQLMDVLADIATAAATPTFQETPIANTIRNRESDAGASVSEDQRSTSTSSLVVGLISALIRSSATAVALTCGTEIPSSTSDTPSFPYSLPIKLQKNSQNKKPGFEDKIIADKRIPISKTAQEKGPWQVEGEEDVFVSLFDCQSFRDLQYKVSSYHERIGGCVGESSRSNSRRSSIVPCTTLLPTMEAPSIRSAPAETLRTPSIPVSDPASSSSIHFGRLSFRLNFYNIDALRSVIQGCGCCLISERSKLGRGRGVDRRQNVVKRAELVRARATCTASSSLSDRSLTSRSSRRNRAKEARLKKGGRQ